MVLIELLGVLGIKFEVIFKTGLKFFDEVEFGLYVLLFYENGKDLSSNLDRLQGVAESFLGELGVVDF